MVYTLAGQGLYNSNGLYSGRAFDNSAYMAWTFRLMRHMQVSIFIYEGRHRLVSWHSELNICGYGG
jgi:hypothetical protein